MTALHEVVRDGPVRAKHVLASAALPLMFPLVDVNGNLIGRFRQFDISQPITPTCTRRWRISDRNTRPSDTVPTTRNRRSAAINWRRSGRFPIR